MPNFEQRSRGISHPGNLEVCEEPTRQSVGAAILAWARANVFTTSATRSVFLVISVQRPRLFLLSSPACEAVEAGR